MLASCLHVSHSFRAPPRPALTSALSLSLQQRASLSYLAIELLFCTTSHGLRHTAAFPSRRSRLPTQTDVHHPLAKPTLVLPTLPRSSTDPFHASSVSRAACHRPGRKSHPSRQAWRAAHLSYVSSFLLSCLPPVCSCSHSLSLQHPHTLTILRAFLYLLPRKSTHVCNPSRSAKRIFLRVYTPDNPPAPLPCLHAPMLRLWPM